MISFLQSRLWCAVLGLLGLGLSGLNAAGMGVTFGWDPSPNPQAFSYVIYSGTKPGVYTSRTVVGLVTNVTLRGFVAGKTYYVAASTVDAAGYEGQVSPEITVTLSAPPAIATHPQDLQVVAGLPAAFGVAVTGTPPFVYQWQFNGTPIPGATADTLTLPAVGLDQAGLYSVVVTNSAGAVTSNPAQLTVTPANTPPTLGPVVDVVLSEGTTPPLIPIEVNDTETPADDLVLTLSSSDEVLLPSSLFTVTGDGAHRSLQLAPTAGLIGSADVTLVVSDGLLSTATQFTITVIPVPPAVTVQPADQSALVGADVSFTVAATGTAPMSYQWRFNDTDLPGATNNVLILPAVTLDQAGSYSATIQNIAGGTMSRNAVLQVALPNTPPGIEPIPDVVVNQGDPIPPVRVLLRDAQTPASTLTLTAVSSDNGLLPTGLIQISGDAGERSLQLVPGDPEGWGTASITLTVSDGELTSSSAFSVLILPVGPSISLQPVDQSAFWGTAVSFLVAATGTPPLRYQWLYNGTEIPGATNDTLLLPAVTASAAGTYSARVGNLAGQVFTRDATLEAASTNWPPTLDPTPDVTVYTGAPSPTIVRLTVRDFDTPAEQLLLSAVSSDESLLPTSAIGIAGTGANRELKLAGTWRDPGTSLITLSLSDGATVTTQDFRFSVVLSNAPPVVDAGKSGFVATGANYLLRGRATDDGLPADPGRLTVGWQTVAGPADAVFGNPESLVTSVTLTAAGIYRLRLTAFDGEKTAFAEITLDASGDPDTVPPVISNLQVISVRDDSITLSWTTDSLADEAVEYASATDAPLSQSSGNDVQLAHWMTVTNLSPATTYTVRAHSRDLAGNDTFSDPVKVSTLRHSRVYLTLHPEDALLTPPMQLDSSADGLGFLFTPGYLSGGSAFPFHVPVDGEFAVWMRVLAVDNNTDSFFVHVDDGPEDIYDAVHNQWSPSWQWDVLNGRAGSYPLTENPRTFTLSAGPHTLYLRGRETNCALSRIVITNDRDYVPASDAVTECSCSTTLQIPVRAGWSMVGNPLATASPRLSDLLPSPGPGTTFYKYQSDSGKLVANFFDGTRWSQPDMVLLPGEGGLINNRGDAFSWVLRGTVPSAPPPPNLHAGPNFLVLQPPRAGLLPALLEGTPFQAGDTIQQVDFQSGTTRTCTYNGEQWDILPVVNLGEPFFLNLSPR